MSERAPVGRNRGWPDRGRLVAWMRMTVVFWAVFFPVYFVSGHVAARSGRAIVLALPGPRSINTWPIILAGK